MASVYALVVAAGRGSRFGGDVPKQYLPLGGARVLRHAVAALARHQRVTGVLVTIRPEDRALYDDAVAGLPVLDEDHPQGIRNGTMWCWVGEHWVSFFFAKNGDSQSVHCWCFAVSSRLSLRYQLTHGRQYSCRVFGGYGRGYDCHSL